MTGDVAFQMVGNSAWKKKQRRQDENDIDGDNGRRRQR